MTGKLIVLEGLSAAGKQTQCRLLQESLQKAGKKAVLHSFPDYDSQVGQLIAAYLAGNWGKKEDSIQTAVILYALDRYQNAPKIKEDLEQNDYVILDRYSPSNYAYQGALVKNQAEKNRLWQWIDAVEARLPKADAVVFLDVPRKVTQKNYARREAKNPLVKQAAEKDIHESDADFENNVHQNYLELARKRDWIIMDCIKDGQLLPAETISERIQKALMQRILA